MNQKDTRQFNRAFRDMVKILAIIGENVNIFTMHETLFEIVITISTINYHDKTKMPGKIAGLWFSYKK